jgi:hypothetical protein
MKTIQNLTWIALFVIFNLSVGYSQQTSEVRKGSTVAYSVVAGHIAGEEYRWEIVGGTPSPAATSGTGTVADPYIITYTANLHTINVTWGTDNNNTIGDAGNVRVQKRSAGGCISVLQDMQVTCWSAATAVISGATTAAICNGENVGYTVAVNFTGAPNFALDYRIDNNLTGMLQTTNQTISNITGGSTSISIPDNLINTTSSPQTYTITLTRMNDGFTGDGTISATAYTYTITVNPAASTGPITVSPASLQRRP